jgi:hypothetical protein
MVDKFELLKAHAEYVRLRAFLKEHDFLNGPKDGENPFIGVRHYFPPLGIPNPNPTKYFIAIIIQAAARVLRQEPRIGINPLLERLERPLTLNRFRTDVWLQAHSMAGTRPKRGPKGPRTKT